MSPRNFHAKMAIFLLVAPSEYSDLSPSESVFCLACRQCICRLSDSTNMHDIEWSWMSFFVIVSHFNSHSIRYLLLLPYWTCWSDQICHSSWLVCKEFNCGNLKAFKLLENDPSPYESLKFLKKCPYFGCCRICMPHLKSWLMLYWCC